MSLSMKYLFVVAVLSGTFEVLSAVWLNAPNLAGQLTAAGFAALLLGCAWTMRRRGSLIAASVIGLLLLVDVAGVPFYDKGSWLDWVIQLAFVLVGAVGVVAWVTLLRGRRRRAAVDVG